MRWAQRLRAAAQQITQGLNWSRGGTTDRFGELEDRAINARLIGQQTYLETPAHNWGPVSRAPIGLQLVGGFSDRASQTYTEGTSQYGGDLPLELQGTLIEAPPWAR